MWAKIRTDLFLKIFTIILLAEIPTTVSDKQNIYLAGYWRDRETSTCRWVVGGG